MTVILYAIPVFFFLIALELVAEKMRGTDYYRVNDAITSLSIGVLSRMTGILKALVPFSLYFLCYEHFRLFEISNNGLTFVIIFVLYDFLYYWNHRFGHEISLFWAAHVVHHSSEDYNLTTALRQTSGSFFNFIFFIPLALIGVDPLTMLTIASLNLVYQFWVHTQHVNKLGWLEWILVTPSNHRVHHAQNQIYLDKNYGGVFIVWDRIFGTFQEELEEEKCIYGVRKALNSWNPVYANMQVYKQLMMDSCRTQNWKDKIRVWLGRTGWRPSDIAEKYPLLTSDLSSFHRFNTELTLFEKCYGILQYVFVTGLALFLLLNVQTIELAVQISWACLVIFGSVALAVHLEKSAKTKYLQLAYSGVLLAIALWQYSTLPAISLVILFYAAINTSLALTLRFDKKRLEERLS